MIRAALYYRVSTIDQEQGTSLTSQAQACIEYANRNGMEVVLEVQDSVSGATLEREGLDRIRTAIAAHEIDAVVTYTLDRLSRSLVHTLILREEFKKAGVELHLVNRGRAEETPEGTLMQNMESVIAEYERTLIRERTRRGKLTKAKKRWVGVSVPYGYKRIGVGRDADLEINPTTAAIVKRIFHSYLGYGGQPAKHLLAIATELTAEGIPPNGRSKYGWSSQSVRYILMNRSYLGEFSYAGVVIHRPDLAIIDQETFDAAQVKRERNATTLRHNRKYEYLLAGGYLRCSCGRSMIAWVQWRKGTQKYFYYACGAHRKKYLYGCEEKPVRADKVDTAAWNWVAGLLSDEQNLLAGIREMNRRQVIELAPRRARLELIEGLITEKETQAARLARALARASSDTEAEVLEVELRAVGKLRDQLADEREMLQAQVRPPVGDEEVESIRELVAVLREEIAGADYETKRALIDRLGLKVQLRRVGDDLHGYPVRALDMTCIISEEVTSLRIDGSRSGATNNHPLTYALILEDSVVFDYV